MTTQLDPALDDALIGLRTSSLFRPVSLILGLDYASNVIWPKITGRHTETLAWFRDQAKMLRIDAGEERTTLVRRLHEAADGIVENTAENKAAVNAYLALGSAVSGELYSAATFAREARVAGGGTEMEEVAYQHRRLLDLLFNGTRLGMVATEAARAARPSLQH